MWTLLTRPSMSTCSRLSRVLILFRDFPNLGFTINLAGITANQQTGALAFIPIRGHQRSTEFNIPQPWGEQSVTLNSKELWGSASAHIAHSCLDFIFQKCFEQLSCVSLLMTILREEGFFSESLWYYLTFSMELSPSHDFNSDKLNIYRLSAF